jgi:hypothetical protein
MAADTTSRLVGAWVTDDGDVFLLETGGAATVAGLAMTWTDDGAMLVLSNEEGNAVFLYQVSGERLLLLGDEGPLPLTRQA